MKDDPWLLWIDLETAGTNEAQDPILEIGCILTGSELEPVRSYESLVQPKGESLAYLAGRLTQGVREMHTRNGLLDALTDGGPEAWEAEGQVIEMIAHYGDRQDFVLAGSGVAHFDRRFLDAQMPRLASWLRYYCIDVGVLRRSLEILGLGSAVPSTNDYKPHRAMADVRLHLGEMRHYRRVLNDWKARADDQGSQGAQAPEPPQTESASVAPDHPATADRGGGSRGQEDPTGGWMP